jgi:hypothetical protein
MSRSMICTPIVTSHRERTMENGFDDPKIQEILHPAPGRAKVFLDGPAGTGKTTAAVQRMLTMLQNYVPAESILVWVPQRALATPYREALWELDLPGGEVTIVTVGGLARRMVDLYWPIAVERAGFGEPAKEPTFLTLETTQYFMDRIVAPFIEAGYFDSLSVRRNRLVSQIIDNLNKAAVVGFPHTEIAARLKSAWGGESARRAVYDQAQACAAAFRQYCLAHNLLDFSLQYEVFFQHLLVEPICRQYLFDRYRHLIVDNIEEDTPRAQDLLREWLEVCQTALVVMDRGGGYRAFLGADAEGAEEVRWSCQERLALEHSHVTSPEIASLGTQLVQSLGSQVSEALSVRRTRRVVDPRPALFFNPVRFQPQMYEWVADQVASLIETEQVPPDEIVILAPFLGDALRFALADALARRKVPVRSHRPSRALRAEPATRCLLTLATIAHPDWEICPTPSDVVQALMTAIEGLDLVRAQLLTEIAYRPREGRPAWSGFDQIQTEMQERITFVFGERFDRLRRWMSEYRAQPPLELDDFCRELFTAVLSRPGFGFHHDLDAGRITSNLIESIQKFRYVVGPTLPAAEGSDRLAIEYVRMVDRGIIAATYVQSWQIETAGAVLMAPAYTFLMANRPVDVQFWLDVGSGGWWERLYQPLTHPYVLSRHWPADRVWGDEDEFAVRQDSLARLVLGLVRRCRKRVYLGISELGAQGYEQRGPLLHAVQDTLRRFRRD